MLDNMKDGDFGIFCAQNKKLRIERNESYQILLQPPIINSISIKNADLIADLGIWNRKLKAGLVFESSAGFYLPDTSMRSPDAAWISHERWNALNEERRKGFAYIAPDFVVELASPSDSLLLLKAKMEK
jgi:Uma2 family endonuclease